MHMEPRKQAVLRCAVYTGKSSEERLHRVSQAKDKLLLISRVLPAEAISGAPSQHKPRISANFECLPESISTSEPRWREVDSNFQYRFLVCRTTSRGSGSRSLFP